MILKVSSSFTHSWCASDSTASANVDISLLIIKFREENGNISRIALMYITVTYISFFFFFVLAFILSQLLK